MSKNALDKYAWIVAPGQLLLFASLTSNSSNEGPNAFTNTPVTKLIYGINEEFGSERFRFLRLPIETNYTLSLWERGLIKVCAKRHRQYRSFSEAISLTKTHLDIGIHLRPRLHQYGHEAEVGHHETYDEALRRVTRIERGMRLTLASQKRFSRHRCVAVTILDPEGTVMVTATNTNAYNQVLHAEVNALAQLANNNIQTLRPGSTIVSSLKPCIMCANLILDFTGSRNDTKIIAGQDDYGSFGRHNVLGQSLQICSVT